jgi:DNA invertase Pin-like site-specific DNA recombinase
LVPNGLTTYNGYITVVAYQVRGTVLHVADDRKTGSLAEFYALLSEEQKQGIESVCMDNSPLCQHSRRFIFLPSNVIGGK